MEFLALNTKTMIKLLTFTRKIIKMNASFNDFYINIIQICYTL